MPEYKIVVESHIPFIKGCLEKTGCRVLYLPPEEITAQAVSDADALIVRTRTRCDSALLAGSKVRIVATATIGTDHIDMQWCRQAGISVANAPGCNAPAVAQYVMASIGALINRPVHQHTLGIIGVGHVGKIVERWARALDMNVMLCDPVRERHEGGDNWCSAIDIARRADIITIHTPLTRDGEDATYHLVNSHFLENMRRWPILINAARGAVIDTPAVIDALDSGLLGAAVIDCWEGEPNINPQLLQRAAIATPHIAGYSAQGKVRATAAALAAVAHTLHLPFVPQPNAEIPGPVPQTVTLQSVMRSYNPIADTLSLRREFNAHGPAAFEALRNNYNLRTEAPEANVD